LPVSVGLAERRLFTPAELCLHDGAGPVNPCVHSARRYSPESEAALRQVHSGSAWKPALAHGSRAGPPATTSVNQDSSTQAKCLSSPPSVIDESRSATRNCSSLNPPALPFHRRPLIVEKTKHRRDLPTFTANPQYILATVF
jgi:hypothetical protein